MRNTRKIDIPVRPAPLDDDEWHIAGVLVQTRPTHIARVSESIESISGSEIHAASDNGKLVVTLEAPSSRAIAAHLTFIQQIDGVLNTALIYQHNEMADAMNEEMDDESLSPRVH